MPATTPGTPQFEFIDVVRKVLGDVLSKACKGSWTFALQDPKAESGEDRAGLSFDVSVSGELRGTASIEIRREDALTLAQKALGETGDSISELNDDCRRIVKELLEQVARAAEIELKSRFGDVLWQVTAGNTQPGEGNRVVLSAGGVSEGAFSLVLRLSEELGQSIALHKAGSQTARRESEQASSRPDEANLDLLRDVNLSLTLRFGQRTLTLREILDLNSGSVIELDRKVQDPADLLLGEKLIARGEVVVVDGNYGIRITEVADPRQGAEGSGAS